MDRVLKSVRINLPGRPSPAPAPSAAQGDVDALRSANAIAHVGLWPPPRA